MKKLTGFSYKHLDIVTIGKDAISNSVMVQFFFCPDFIITGSIVDEAKEMFQFREENIEDQDFGTDYYKLSKAEADHLISLCCGYSIEKYPSDDNKLDLEENTISQNMSTLTEVLKAFEGERK